MFRLLLDKNKATRNTRSCDYWHLLLLLPFILSNLFREEVDEHNRRNRGHPVVDPSEELIGVTYVFLRWYKLFRKTTPGKTPSDIGTLQFLSTRYVSNIAIIHKNTLYLIYDLNLLYQFFLVYSPLLTPAVAPPGCRPSPAGSPVQTRRSLSWLEIILLRIAGR